jgi:hypothetical protein
VAVRTVGEIEQAVRESWAAGTCSPDDVAREPWSARNPAWGQCAVTALVVHDLFGGALLAAKVYLDGEQQGFHNWNRMPARWEEHRRFRSRVLERLGEG